MQTTLERNAAGETAHAPIDTTPRDEFLDRVDTSRRATITNKFLAAVRAGLHDPAAIVTAVLSALADKISRARNPQVQQSDLCLHAVIVEYPESALAFARYAVAWEALPEAVRDNIKAERSQYYLSEHMQKEPPSAAQMTYLLNLGYRDTWPKTKQEASELIALYVERKREGKTNNG